MTSPEGVNPGAGDSGNSKEKVAWPEDGGPITVELADIHDEQGNEILIPASKKLSRLKEWIAKENLSFVAEKYKEDGYTDEEFEEAIVESMISGVKSGRLDLMSLVTSDPGPADGGVTSVPEYELLTYYKGGLDSPVEDPRILALCKERYEKDPSFKEEWERQRILVNLPDLSEGKLPVGNYEDFLR